MSGNRNKAKDNCCHDEIKHWEDAIVAARYASATVKPIGMKAEEQPRADKMVKQSRNKGL
jgi:hypothetical protein